MSQIVPRKSFREQLQPHINLSKSMMSSLNCNIDSPTYLQLVDIAKNMLATLEEAERIAQDTAALGELGEL